ncbi:unnamed protein product [Calypogeia fissa]
MIESNRKMAVLRQPHGNGRPWAKEWSTAFWIAGLAILVFSVFPAEAATDPTDEQVLNAFMQGLTSASQGNLGWSGTDPCGSNWPYIQCNGGSVTALQVGNLKLSGTVTPTLNKMISLTRLELQGNSLTGTLPSLSGMSSLGTVYLSNNQFDTIPGDFFDGLTGLQFLYLDYLTLNGTGWILPDISFCTQLTNLSMTQANLVGNIPDFLGTMPSLRVLNLAYNLFTGGLPASFSASSLSQLEVNNMNLNGPITVVGSMVNLVQLWLQVNKFSGPIPAGLCDATGLKSLRLNDATYVGQIPSCFANLPLTELIVKNNDLVGPIPPFKVNPITDTTGNSFCQTTPGTPCDPEVTALLAFLDGVGDSPATLAATWGGNDACTSWTGVTCDAGGKVTALSLPSTNLAGNISSTLGDLSSLQTLRLSNNNLTGVIPSSLAALTSLVTVDVSNNNLSPPIPTFGSGVKLTDSGNPLLLSPVTPSTPATPSPPGTPPASPSPPATSSPPGVSSPPAAGNPTTATPSSSNGTTSGAGSSGSKSNNMTGVIVGVVAGVVVMVILAVIGFCCVHRRKRKSLLTIQGPNTVLVHPRDSGSEPEVVKILVNNSHQPNSVADVSHASSGPSEIQVVEAGNLVISIQVLRSVTKNFSEENVLGRGGFGVVYKGELEDGTKIAVKRMEAAVVSSKGLSEFQAEIAVLTKVRHRHLVALLGYCADGNERLLVYEYMPQGTLSQHIFEHKKLGLKPMDWKRRLSIALDVARGMEYLHSLAHKSFIHRDLKPSNILLGDDFRAKVSDFGLVKLAPEGKFSVETRLAGTFGYLAPEYAVTGRVTTKADVFSFGVVLMELITGRRALDETQAEENMHLVTWFRRMNANKDSFIKAIDPVLEVTDSSSECFRGILTVAELAGHCTAREPYQRPDMGHAVNVLAPLVEQWKPTDLDENEGGIDLEMTLPQALKQWQMYEDASMSGLDDTKASLPTRPTGFAESFTSADGR